MTAKVSRRFPENERAKVFPEHEWTVSPNSGGLSPQNCYLRGSRGTKTSRRVLVHTIITCLSVSLRYHHYYYHHHATPDHCQRLQIPARNNVTVHQCTSVWSICSIEWEPLIPRLQGTCSNRPSSVSFYFQNLPPANIFKLGEGWNRFQIKEWWHVQFDEPLAEK